MFTQLIDEPTKEMAVLRQTVVAVKDISEVPIGSVKNKHFGEKKGKGRKGFIPRC
jgi:hypothetical protein